MNAKPHARRQFLSTLSLAPALAVLSTTRGVEARSWSVKREPGAIALNDETGRTILRYQLERPAESKLSVESGCYFHPFTTPKGIVVTDVAPSDHLHHRGIFLAWVEMHGAKDADFWGWGEHAPKKDRKIVNREVTQLGGGAGMASFTAQNQWMADGTAMLEEHLETRLRIAEQASVVDLTYRLTAKADLVLSRWAFSGFCVRTRKDGTIDPVGAQGPISFANPKHTEPASDWPAARWYGFNLRLPDGTTAGLAVVDDPRNPPSLWHNHRDVRMLNPCLVAPASVTIKAEQPLVLRYRVVAWDGPVQAPSPLLKSAAA